MAIEKQKKYLHHSIRLKGYNYSEYGAYFITTCTKAKVSYFEKYPELKNILQTEWELLPGRFPNMIPDSFVIMPNHIHALIILRPNQRDAAAKLMFTKAETSPAATNPTMIGNIIGSFKSLCMNKWMKSCKQSGIL